MFDSSNGAIPACEEETKANLVAPTSFKLIWSEYTSRAPMTLDEENQLRKSRASSNPQGTGAQIAQAYSDYIDREGPKLARRLQAGKSMSEGDKRDAQQWIDGEKSKADYAARVAKNLPEDQSAFVILEYDAQNSYGALVRNFAMCRFGAIGSDGQFERRDILLSGEVDNNTGQAAKRRSEMSNP